jgi:CYTH domain-containing protein
VQTTLWRKSVSSSRKAGQRGISTFNSGILNGVTIAEIELKQETQELILPRWVGKEVTGDPFYKKINMRARALKAHGGDPLRTA